MSNPSGGNGTPVKLKSTQATDHPASRAPNRDDVDHWNPRTWRELWLSQLSELAEQFMRSPAFLLGLRCTIVLENARTRWLAQLSPSPAPVSISANAPTAHRGDKVR
jgi:hypothetical protein